jgi:hypothetical protein
MIENAVDYADEVFHTGLVKAPQNRQTRNQYSVKVLRSWEEVEEIRDIWERMQWHPNADIDFYHAVISSRKEVLRPHILLLPANGTPKTIVIGRVEDVPFECRIGYKVLFKPLVRSLTIIYGGILGEVSYEMCSLAMMELMNSLARNEADLLFINHLRMNSPAYQLATTIPRALYRDHSVVPNCHWKLSLPNSYEEFYTRLSPNTRYNLRRYSTKLQKKFGLNLTIKCFCENSEIDQLIMDIERISRKTYQHGLGVGFIDNIETRRLITLGLERKWFRAYILYDGKYPCAFWNGFKYGKTFFTGIPGYDPDYKDYRPGTFLLVRMIEDLCNDEHIDAIDFGFGDAQYKRSFCDQNWQEASIHVFSPTFKGLMLNLLRTSMVTGSQLLKNFFQHGQLMPRIKGWWRQLLTPK